MLSPSSFKTAVSVEETVPDDESTAEEDTLSGDVNGDGKITVTDIAKAAAHVKGVKALTDEESKIGDVNNDGKISVTDISMIAAHVKGIKAL